VQFRVQYLYLLLRNSCEFADGWCSEEKFFNWEGKSKFYRIFRAFSYFDKITISDINQDV